MTIDTEVVNRTTAILKVSGRLDTANAALLEQKIKQWGDEITMLILDFENLDYISSMGLRVLLHAKKASSERKREFVIRNMTSTVREVFELTGFINLIVRDEGFAVVRKDEDASTVLYLNGELAIENIPAVQEELQKIKDHGSLRGDTITVVLDMEKLYCLMPSALKHLKQAVADTAWRNRKVTIRNVPRDYREEMETWELVKD
ncbi:MAG: STAS domain-containing protein [Treponema sp.]|nr:STAS domain-containing protein [Treponema sp.]